MRKLKPCPFCGGEAIIEKNHRAFIKGLSTRVAFVYCKKCNAKAIKELDVLYTERNRLDIEYMLS